MDLSEDRRIFNNKGKKAWNKFIPGHQNRMPEKKQKAKNLWQTKEYIQRQKDSHKGKKSHMEGKHHTTESKNKISKSKK